MIKRHNPFDEIDALLRAKQNELEDRRDEVSRHRFVLERLKEIERKLSDLDEWVMKLSEHIAQLARIEIAKQAAERREKRWSEARRKPIRPAKPRKR